ncbi:hypothetical protein E3P99_02636 [Wallemia hederae]|uniref:NADP-dependent oxidoreductase domain-containing protein n=1 Tax=Wallemia hederae TaxID=1540922 RepID=A0A4T0FJY0_9BASI|nr:hypothetical protein E3P99_02636 [Wallemia hederae]
MTQITNIRSTHKLLAGTEIPALQLGVYKSTAAEQSVKTALEGEWRCCVVNIAQFYQNETEVGNAVREYANDEQIFITTKIFQSAGDVDANYAACLESVKKIGRPVDLFLIHTPRQARGAEDRKSMWLALERLVNEGHVRAIGVSNFVERQLQEVLAYASHPISVNQLELHPWCTMPSTVAFCQERGIICEAYCPLVRAFKAEDETLVSIAKETGKSWAQVLVRWSLQRGFVTLPKSDNPERQKHNADVFDFELSDDQMQKLSALNRDEHCAPWEDILGEP